MKKIFLLPFIVSFFVSCAKQGLSDVYEYKFMIRSDFYSKVAIGSNSPLWEIGDTVGVFAEGTDDAPGVIETLSPSVEFPVRLNAPLSAGDHIYMYAPFRKGEDDCHAVHFCIPEVQACGSGRPCTGAMPLVSIPYTATSEFVTGVTDVADVKFIMLGSVLQFRIYGDYPGEIITSVLFAPGKPVCGTFTYNITAPVEGYESVMAISGYQTDSVRVITETPLKRTHDDPSEILMVVAPGSYSGKLTVVTDRAVYYKELTTEIHAIRGHVKPLSLNLGNAVRKPLSSKGLVAFDDVVFKTFCVRYFDTDGDGEISYDEASLPTSIDVSQLGIKSLGGIEYFIGVNMLDCTGNPELKNIYLKRGIPELKCDGGVSVTFKNFPKCYISLVDDDFRLGFVDTEKAVLDELGIKADFALIPANMTSLSKEQLDRLPAYYESGHNSVLHPEHKYWYTDATHTFIDVEHVENAMLNCITAYKDSHIDDGLEYIVYPGGSHEPGVREMCRKYCRYGIGTGSLGNYNYDLSRPYDIHRIMLSFKSNPKTRFKELINRAVKEKSWLVFGTHAWQYTDSVTVDEITQSIPNFREVLEYAKSVADFKSVREVLDEFIYDDEDERN